MHRFALIVMLFFASPASALDEINTPLMSDLIMKGEVHEIKALMKKSREQGMQTFDDALFELLNENAITIEEAMRNADSVNDLRLRIKLESGSSSVVDDMVTGSMSLEENEGDAERRQAG